MGLALSGGGIRSATFAFGFLQALANRKVLANVDLLSTVSGGGYTGGMLTRLFSRAEVRDHRDAVRAILPSHNGDSESEAPQSDGSESIRSGAVLSWLRENGHHLAPNGAGDLLLGGAVIFRNWLSVHVVVWTLLLAAFILLQLLRYYALQSVDLPLPTCTPASADGPSSLGAWLTCRLPLGERYLWWSPWLVLPVAIFVLWVMPTGLAYWLMPAAKDGKSRLAKAFGLLVLLGAGAAFLSEPGVEHEWTIGVALFALLAACAIQALAVWAARRSSRSTCAPAHQAALPCTVPVKLEVSHKLSSWLKSGLVAFALAVGLALVDTSGQTLYAVGIAPDISLGATLAGVFGALAALATGARKLAVRFRGDGGSARPRLRLKVAGTAAAVLVLTATLVSLNALAHGLFWDFTYPHGIPTELWRIQQPAEAECPTVAASCRDPEELAQVVCPSKCQKRGEPTWQVPVVYLVLLTLLSLLFGRSCRFLNNSTLQPLYRARLIRAYLGASNPKRLDPRCPNPVTKMLAGDDVAVDWDDPKGEFADPDPWRKYRKGAPLHIVNVTVNETVEKKTGLQRSDRRGIGMAVGPAGVSGGIRHHVVFGPPEPERKGSNLPARAFPRETARTAGLGVPTTFFACSTTGLIPLPRRLRQTSSIAASHSRWVNGSASPVPRSPPASVPGRTLGLRSWREYST